MTSEDGSHPTEYDFITQHAPDNVRHEDIVLVSEPSRELLNERQLVDFRAYCEKFVNWLLYYGKDPTEPEGYARGVVEQRAGTHDKFARWVWDREGGYTTDVTHKHADAYLDELHREGHSATYKANVQNMLLSLFRWRDDIDDWNPERRYSSRSSPHPADYLTLTERTAIRESALEYDSLPAYAALSPEERNRWQHYLAARLGKSVSEVSPADFEEVGGFKWASMVCTSLDAGLRPVEVGRAQIQWVDFDNALLRIPREDSAKSDEPWIIALQETTAELLEEWIRERECYPKYDETDRLWLTRHANPYGSSALKYVLEKLAENAGIDTEGRSLSWYSIRHSVGTYMAREEGLAAAQSQLRHTSQRTTAKYDNAPPEDRRNALDRMG